MSGIPDVQLFLRPFYFTGSDLVKFKLILLGRLLFGTSQKQSLDKLIFQVITLLLWHNGRMQRG